MAIPVKSDLNGDATTQGAFKNAIGLLWDWVNGKAELNGDNTQTFKVADAVNSDESVSKGQLYSNFAKYGEGNALGKYTNDVSTNNADYNSITLTGIYSASQTANNHPPELEHSVTLFVMGRASTYTQQIAVDDGSGRVWTRHQTAGTWDTWREIITSNKYTNNLTQNGYQILPSGLIIQWMYTPNSVVDGDTVTFPIAFPNGVFIATHTANEAGTYCYSVYNLTLNNCIVSKRDNSKDVNNRYSSLIVIGY